MVRLALLSLCALACHETPSAPHLGEPFFYLVLYPGHSWDGIGEGTSYALSLTLESTIDVRCRPVEHFSMRRAEDGSPFAWRTDGACEILGTNPNYLLAACCTLPLEHPDSLGGGDLRDGETYTIDVAAGGVRQRGTTTIPSSFSVTVAQRDGQDVAIWSTSAGAAAYAVTDGNYETYVTTDTEWTLPPSPAERTVHVEALDENLYRYTTGGMLDGAVMDPERYRQLDGGIVRSGLDAGQGVFGSMWSPGPVAY